MKKIVLIITVLLSFITQAQTQQHSPDGLLENLFDNYGNKFSLSDIKVEQTKILKDGSRSTTVAATCANGGYFDLFFENGSGMETVGNPTHDARRNVVCKVFRDLSNFISAPHLVASGNKINIWVRNPLNVGFTSTMLGGATAYYALPNYSNGGIADNEIWKTIHTGADSYYYLFPLVSSNPNNTGTFYHGWMAFNFNNPASVNWNTDLSIAPSTAQYDLYTVVLHEMIHALGFASLINQNGASTINGWNYFSRYDQFLMNSSGTANLIKKLSSSCSIMYEHAFNPVLNTSILSPSATCNTGNTTCASALRYKNGATDVPIFTPNCYEAGSSFSHFEDSCIPPFVNNGYFVMSDRIGTGGMKRYPKPEERNVLCDIGYTVGTTFGDSGTFNGVSPANSYGTTACGGIIVAGVNDGIVNSGVNTGTFNYIAQMGVSYPISGVLGNDKNADSLECVQDMTATGTFPTTISLNGTTINFMSNLPGIHLLRYVPFNTISQQRGNITYVYVVVLDNCSTTTCEFVKNGGFETSTSCGQFLSPPTTTSPKITCWAPLSLTPDLFKRNCTVSGSSWSGNIPTPYSNPQSDTWNNGTNGNNNFIGFAGSSGTYREAIQTRLGSAIQPNQQYRLSFKAKVLNTFTGYGNGLVGSNLPTTIVFAGSQNMLANTTIYTVIPSALTTLASVNVPNNNSWNSLTVVLNATTVPLDFLTIYNGYGISITNNNTFVYAVVDDISITPLLSGSFTLPSSMCLNQTIPNLNSYLSSVQNTGAYTGPGVSYSGGIYSFNSSIAGLGTHTITYTYCSSVLTSTLTVSACSPASCPGNLVFNTPQTALTATYQAASTIVTNTNYLVNAGSTITLTAGNSITFSPTSEVKANSTSNFTAKIEACTQTSGKIVETESEIKNSPELVLFPNPTDDFTTIQLKNDEFNKIVISTIEGRVILNEVVKATSEHKYNTAHLKSGIYIVSIETSNGGIISKKLIKK